MTTHSKTHLLSLAMALSLVALPAMAQDTKPGQQTTGGVTVGAQTGSGIDDSSKLQQYETVPKGVVLFDAHFDWQNASRYFMTFQGNKLGLDDQSAAFQGGQKGAWSISASLDQNPRWFSNKAETLYNQSAPGVFTLADGMRSSLQRIWSPATTDPKAPADSNDDRFWSVRDYMNGAQPVDLRYVRKTGLIGFDFSKLEHWTFDASYQRETRNGSQPLAFTAGPGIDEIANPIQYTTQDAKVEVEYAKDRFFVDGMFTRSLFHNDVLFTTVDNPVRLNNTDFFWTGSPVTNTSANATARLWNAPDNRATNFDVTAGIRLPEHHKVTVTASTGVMSVNQALIPQATNPDLNLATNNANYGKFSLSPEYASVSPKLDQTLWMVNFTGDPQTLFGYSVFYRSYDLKDKTPEYVFHSTVNSDGGASYSATGNTSAEDARGYSSGQFKIEGHVTPVRGIRIGLNGGILKTTYQDRMFDYVKDNTLGLTMDANRAWVGFHGGYTRLWRNPGPIQTDETDGEFETILDPNARFRDVSKQNANLYNAAVTLTPIDKAALTLSTQGINSTFPDTSIGLQKSTMNNVGIDLTYAFNDKVSANAAYIYEKFHMDTQLWYAPNGNGTTPATNTADQYSNAINDRIDTFKVGLRWDVKPNQVDVGTDYDYSKGRSDQGFTVVPGGAAGGDMLFPTNTTTVNFAQFQYLNYPQVFNATTIWKTWLNYHLNKNVTVGFLYWRQKFDQADWAYDSLSPYMQAGSTLYASKSGVVNSLYPLLDPGANRALVLGAVVPNYDANIFRVSLNYRF